MNARGEKVARILPRMAMVLASRATTVAWPGCGEYHAAGGVLAGSGIGWVSCWRICVSRPSMPDLLTMLR